MYAFVCSTYMCKGAASGVDTHELAFVKVLHPSRFGGSVSEKLETVSFPANDQSYK